MNYSIVIPTYQRIDNLNLILERLAQSVSCRTSVLLITEPDSNSLPTDEKMAVWSDKLDIKVSINLCNAGVDESILRAYEQCESEWIYFLGDSKLPIANFEPLLKSAYSKCPDAAAYFFSFDSDLTSDLRISSIKSLVESGLTLGDFILGGNSVFSQQIVKKYISQSYRTLSSRIAHVAMPLIALSKGESLFVSKERIIDAFIEKPATYQPGKALLDCWASFSLLSLMPITKDEAKLINRYVVKNETVKSRTNFYKYILIKIFREKTSISKDLVMILNCRYIFYTNLIEMLAIRVLYVLAESSDCFRHAHKHNVLRRFRRINH